MPSKQNNIESLFSEIEYQYELDLMDGFFDSMISDELKSVNRKIIDRYMIEGFSIKEIDNTPLLNFDKDEIIILYSQDTELRLSINDDYTKEEINDIINNYDGSYDNKRKKVLILYKHNPIYFKFITQKIT